MIPLMPRMALVIAPCHMITGRHIPPPALAIVTMRRGALVRLDCLRDQRILLLILYTLAWVDKCASTPSYSMAADATCTFVFSCLLDLI